jgi:hypothetical protein
MKKLKLQALALVLFAGAAFTSCSDDDSKGLETEEAFVTLVTGAATADLNQEITLTATFAVDNNCGSFNKFNETTNGTTKTIAVEAKYTGSDCGTTPTTKTAAYKFKQATAGTYTLKFKKSATEFVTHTVVVD